MARDFSWIVVAYAVALLVAGAVVLVAPFGDPLWDAALADVLATIIIFGFSSIFRNASFYDAYWSVVPPVLFLFWMLAYGQQWDLRALLLMALVVLWSIRLTWNWARGWQGLNHEDWRYVDLAEKTGFWYPLVNFLGIQLFPTVLVFLGCLPLWLLAQSGHSGLGWLDTLWLLIGFAALALEYRADQVLHRFRASPRNPGEVLQHDVWRWSRHPNYLGELGFWAALAIAGFTVSAEHLAWVGISAMLLLFILISIPMIEKRQLANKPAYAEYQRRVPMLIPGFKRP